MMFTKKILLFFLFTVIPLHASAELNATVTLTPPNPTPYETVVITLVSYTFDVNVATITWTSGNKTLLSGFGARRLSLNMGGSGQTLPVAYTATTVSGESVSGLINLTPQSVDLIYEAQEGYVPPFYEGRSLPGEGAIVRVTAIPDITENGAKVSPSSLSYSWYINGEYVDRASGAGKSVASIEMDYLSDTTNIRVLIRSPRGVTAEKSISIHPHATMPLLYAYDELLGTDFSRLLYRRLEITKDITISLQPFYLSVNGSLGAHATYDWYLDGLPITPQEKTLISFRPKTDSYGVRGLTVTVDSTKRKLQRAQNALEILFDTRP